MKAHDPKAIEAAMYQMFPPEWVRGTARETGLVKRERKVDPVVMLWVLTLSFGVRLQRTLASLKRNYEKASSTRLSDSSWYERFTPELVAFLKQCVVRGIEALAQQPSRKLESKLAGFKDLLIQDSTIVRLHKALSDKWPASRARTVAAGVKVSMLVSAVADGPKRVGLHSERTNEVKTLRIGPWVRDRILLIDMGFFKYQLFTRITENGGHFVTRLKNGADPVITSTNLNWRGNTIDVVGKPLSEVLPKLKRQVLDVEVEVTFRRRKYRDRQRNDTANFRLVAVYNDEAKKYHLYLTDIPTEVLSAEDIAALYSARWNVELIFKELKSRYAMDVVNTKNPQIVEAYIWTAMLTLIVSRRIYKIVRETSTKDIIRYTQLRWSKIFAENADVQLTLILAYYGIKRTFNTVLDVYQSQALDPHVNRDRLMDRWRA
jgi:IS4 transposase